VCSRPEKRENSRKKFDNQSIVANFSQLDLDLDFLGQQVPQHDVC
jgi:hypothetical protein